MKAINIPAKFNIPFANNAGSGFIRPIPQASQIPTNPGYASLTDGFPPLNFLPLGAGGIPPFGQDMNGLMKQVTQWNQWAGTGNPVQYDATFSGQIGGYPQGAMLGQAANVGQFWISLVDDNTSNPDSGGANWLAFPAAQISIVGRTQIFTATANFTVPANVTQVEIYGVGGGGAGGCSGDGSGGGAAGNIGGGGGAAAYGYKRVTGLTPGQVILTTIGAGGVASNASQSGSGGSTSFGAFMTLAGGLGGSSGVSTLATVGNGGAATGADFSVPGAGGGFSGPNVLSVTLSDAERMYGRGGLAGGGWSVTSWGGTGGAGLGYGTGGNGASGGSLLLGGNGAPGLLFVRW